MLHAARASQATSRVGFAVTCQQSLEADVTDVVVAWVELDMSAALLKVHAVAVCILSYATFVISFGKHVFIVGVVGTVIMIE